MIPYSRAIAFREVNHIGLLLDCYWSAETPRRGWGMSGGIATTATALYAYVMAWQVQIKALTAKLNTQRYNKVAAKQSYKNKYHRQNKRMHLFC